MIRRHRMSLVAAALASTFALAACDRADESTTVGQRADSAIAQGEQKAEEAKQATQNAMGEARQEAGQAAADAKQGAENLGDKAAAAVADAKQGAANMADKAGAAMSDATITTKVNAELAKDTKLSALDIDVDTSNGRVELKGKAPDQAASERATQLASAVEGVVSVDNKLTVGM